VKQEKSIYYHDGIPDYSSPKVSFSKIETLGVNTRVTLSNGKTHVLCGRAQDPLPKFVKLKTFEYDEFVNAVKEAGKLSYSL
jgi:hypothetical protein